MKKTVISFALAIVILCSFSLFASAQNMPEAPLAAETSTIVQLDDMTAPGQEGAEGPGVQGESSAQSEYEVAYEDVPTESEVPAPEKSNTPYLVGAGIAILVFLGVAFYCKTNGNKTL